MRRLILLDKDYFPYLPNLLSQPIHILPDCNMCSVIHIFSYNTYNISLCFYPLFISFSVLSLACLISLLSYWQSQKVIFSVFHILTIRVVYNIIPRIKQYLSLFINFFFSEMITEIVHASPATISLGNPREFMNKPLSRLRSVLKSPTPSPVRINAADHGWHNPMLSYGSAVNLPGVLLG